MSTKFTAGQKVKCIKAGGSDNKLQEGTVYTVERVGACGEVYLVELKNPHTYSGWYGAKRFEAAPEDTYSVTVRYPNGGFGITQFFESEQAAREYVEQHGISEYTYDLSKFQRVVTLKVQEETTVTRSVISA
jgi:hypothetical protein